MAEKATAKSQPQEDAKKKRGGKGARRLHLLLAGIIVLSIVFLPAAIILFIGLLPMFVAFFADRSKKKIRAVTVGAMNIAGCVPFLMALWTSDFTMARALSIILEPTAIIVIYALAGIGYLIDWACSVAVAGLLYQRGLSRQEAIEQQQKELIARWGEEVTGKIPLDREGFPLEEAPPPKA